ncbi:hypothetical protein BJ138DRAFT_22932 [Hygrophoropsis aurantiaca]|uniref:Uncharacterized protein n=1 Tax=Hygrophoropsis aurantiaca TaxID=72124 RepID=A0ACB8ACW3_9AGAM|nr:hypothetical protein BJ138DRAFT_22932 [Hygrophoropsis aurantiaca]
MRGKLILGTNSFCKLSLCFQESTTCSTSVIQLGRLRNLDEQPESDDTRGVKYRPCSRNIVVCNFPRHSTTRHREVIARDQLPSVHMLSSFSTSSCTTSIIHFKPKLLRVGSGANCLYQIMEKHQTTNLYIGIDCLSCCPGINLRDSPKRNIVHEWRLKPMRRSNSAIPGLINVDDLLPVPSWSRVRHSKDCP